jgi:hypothetical protein
LCKTSSDYRVHKVNQNPHSKYTIYKYKTIVLTPNSEITLGSLFWTWSYKCLGLAAKKGLIHPLMRYKYLCRMGTWLECNEKCVTIFRGCQMLYPLKGGKSRTLYSTVGGKLVGVASWCLESWPEPNFQLTKWNWIEVSYTGWLRLHLYTHCDTSSVKVVSRSDSTDTGLDIIQKWWYCWSNIAEVIPVTVVIPAHVTSGQDLCLSRISVWAGSVSGQDFCLGKICVWVSKICIWAEFLFGRNLFGQVCFQVCACSLIEKRDSKAEIKIRILISGQGLAPSLVVLLIDYIGTLDTSLAPV